MSQICPPVRGESYSIYPPETRIPLDVYLYGFLGSMGYIYTTLLDEFDQPYRALCRYVFRVLIGPLLAASFFLVGDYLLPGDVTDPSVAVGGLMACISFLIGLYPEVAIRRLNGVANALFGDPSKNDNTKEDAGEPTGDDDESSAGDATAEAGDGQNRHENETTDTKS